MERKLRVTKKRNFLGNFRLKENLRSDPTSAEVVKKIVDWIDYQKTFCYLENQP